MLVNQSLTFNRCNSWLSISYCCLFPISAVNMPTFSNSFIFHQPYIRIPFRCRYALIQNHSKYLQLQVLCLALWQIFYPIFQSSNDFTKSSLSIPKEGVNEVIKTWILYDDITSEECLSPSG